MSDIRPNNLDDAAKDGAAKDGATPRDLRGVVRLLEARGARERSRLGADALERIFAASDLQRPLGLEPVSPVIGRIAPARAGSRPFLRMAAAIAALVGLGAVIILALSVRGGGAPAGDQLAEGTTNAPKVPESRAPDARPADPMIAVEHFDAAIEDSIPTATASRTAGAVIVALADRRAGALAGFAASNGAITDELEPLFSTGALLDGSDLTYDDLSQELALVVQGSSPRR